MPLVDPGPRSRPSRLAGSLQNVFGPARLDGQLVFDGRESTLIGLVIVGVELRDRDVAFDLVYRHASHRESKRLDQGHRNPHDPVLVAASGIDGREDVGRVADARRTVKTDPVRVTVTPLYAWLESVR